jgi:hypothetical protein
MGKKLIRLFAAVGLGVLLSLTAYGSALAQAQETQVSGTVTGAAGEKLAGVTVQVRGTDNRTTTDANGRYSLTAPSDGVLLFNLIGFKGAARTVAGRETIDVVLDAAVAVLDPVIVTGYTAQKRADITGAVASVAMEGVAPACPACRSRTAARPGRAAPCAFAASARSRTTIRCTSWTARRCRIRT